MNALWALRDDGGLLDYGSFLAAGKAHELGLNPYAIYRDELAPGARVFTARVGDWQADSVNLNPPITVYGFRALAQFDARTGKYVLSAVSIALFGLIAAGLLRANPQHARPSRILLICNLAGFWHVVQLGQTYVLLLGLVLAAWFLLKQGKTAPAGVALGLLAAIKPPFILVPLLLFLAGRRRAGMIGAGVGAAISVVPLLLDGPQIYDQWFAASRDLTAALVVGPGNGALPGMAGRITDPAVGMVLAGAAVVGGMWLCHRHRPDVSSVFALGIVLILVAGPLTWPGYSLFVLPIVLTRPWRAWEWTTAGILTIPTWVVILAFDGALGELLLGSVYFWAFAIVAVLVTSDIIRQSRVAPPRLRSAAFVARRAA